jgi:hypothetical protein
MARKYHAHQKTHLTEEAIPQDIRQDATQALLVTTQQNPLDTVQIKDQDTGEFLPIEEVIAQYRKAPKGPGGAPGTYDPEFHPRAAFLLCAEHGCNHPTLATHFGVSPSTVKAWVWRYPEFAVSVKNGWSYHMVNSAERALVKRACGYVHEEVKYARVPIYETIFTPAGEPRKVVTGFEEVVAERTVKQQPPDTTALMYLLQNRDGARWKNVRKVEQHVQVDHTLPGTPTTATPAQAVVELTTAELEQVSATAARLGMLPGTGTGNAG